VSGLWAISHHPEFGREIVYEQGKESMKKKTTYLKTGPCKLSVAVTASKVSLLITIPEKVRRRLLMQMLRKGTKKEQEFAKHIFG
jgi:hypothetical protein